MLDYKIKDFLLKMYDFATFTKLRATGSLPFTMHPLATSLLVFLLHFILSKAQPSVECNSDGQCIKTRGRCMPDDIEKCFPYSGNFLYRYLSYAPSGKSISTSDCSTTGNRSDIRLQNLTVKYVSVNPIYVTICVSWSLNGSSGGYKVQFDQTYRQPIAFCTSDSSQTTSLCLNNVEYEMLRYYQMRVKVLPHPLATDDDESKFAISRAFRTNIRGCADVENNNAGCMKRYRKPQDLSVTSTYKDGTKNLSISWSHVKGMPTPDAYYVQLFDEKRKSLNINFKVVNATQIDLSNLDGAVKYYARVQAYRKCSGLGRYYYDPDTLGCGLGRTKLEESLDDLAVLTEARN